MTACAGIHFHAAELIQHKPLAILADPLLAKQRRTARNQPDPKDDHGHQR